MTHLPENFKGRDEQRGHQLPCNALHSCSTSINQRTEQGRRMSEFDWVVRVVLGAFATAQPQSHRDGLTTMDFSREYATRSKQRRITRSLRNDLWIEVRLNQPTYAQCRSTG